MCFFPLGNEIKKFFSINYCVLIYVSDRMLIWGAQDKADLKHDEKSRNGFIAEREFSG